MVFEQNIEKHIKLLNPLISDGERRLCHKVRTSKYYGGIATIDVVGCFLNCIFCWVPEFKRYSEGIKCNKEKFKFQSAEESAEILISLARKYQLKNSRLSGGEPTLNKVHLLKTIDIVVKNDINFILETNGILLDDLFISELDKYKHHLMIYYSLKGISPKYFNLITDCDKELWFLQLKNLRKLVNKGFTVGINTMIDFYHLQEIKNFVLLLNSIHDLLPLAVDIKNTSLFPHVNKRLSYREVKFEKKFTKQQFNSLLIEIFPDFIDKFKTNQILLDNMTFYKFNNLFN